MSQPRRTWPALSALALTLVITAVWWGLALWPVDAATPAWVLRTRAVCFGAVVDGLPDAGGWVLLVGQPVGMLIVLLTVWPAEIRAGVRQLLVRASGQVAVGMLAAVVVVGGVGVAQRVLGAGADSFSTGARDIAGQLTRLDDQAPALDLVDQHGRIVSTADLSGRAALVTFAYAHCETVCPGVVAEVAAAARRFEDRPPVVVVVTLDPWRDTPTRLASMADTWRLPRDAHVLSGEVAEVERVLNAWRIPRIRNERTGDLSHPSIVYVLSPDRRIRYVVQGNADVIAAAVGEL